MAFRFKRKEPVARAIRRFGRDQVERALKTLKPGCGTEAIHRVRTEIKKLRAILRLIRKEIGERRYSEGATSLREAARYLARVRDAHVLLQALNDLTFHCTRQGMPHSFKRLRGILNKRCRAETERFDQTHSAAQVSHALRRFARDFDLQTIRHTGWSAIGPGIKRTHRRFRRGHDIARKRPGPEALHEWRKSAKELWYQVRLLRPVRPKRMRALATDLKTLTEHLGADHDLVLLEEAAGMESKQPGLAAEVAALKRVAAARHQEFRSAAMVLGAHLHGERPATFCKRLSRAWKRWRS